MSGYNADEDWVPSVLLLASMTIGYVTANVTDSEKIGWVVGLLVLFSPFIIIGALLLVDFIEGKVRS